MEKIINFIAEKLSDILGGTLFIITAQRKIRFYLNNGWDTKGDVFIKDNMFCQPMIRIEYE